MRGEVCGLIVSAYDAWRRQEYLLDRMSLKDLVRAYFTYPAIQVYIALAAAAIAVVAVWPGPPFRTALAALAAAAIYPLVWYLLHRFLLHARWLYKSPRTAALWKRIHYDHHQNPDDLAVLFGGLHTTLPTIVLATGPLGWAIAGPAGTAAAIGAGVATTCFYEFCHCIQHLAFRPRSKFLLRIKRLHLAHHYHNENGNYGITNFFWDKAFATFYARIPEVPRSPTVHDLGYTGAEAARFPWVAALSAPAGREDDGAVP